MATEFSNKHDWLAPTLALSIWAAHFMLLWSASSVFPGQSAARWIAVVLTVLAFGGLWLVRRRRSVRGFRTVEGLGVGIATVAVSFTALPALLS
jgi:MYXO-CTERM domain-containing protein